MTADLAGFLLAQLDADAAVARAATRGEWLAERGVIRNAKGDPPIALTHVDRHADADHIALHDPAFELDRIAALRAVVQQALDVIASFGDWDADAAKANGGRVLWTDVNRRERAHAHATIGSIARPYRGRVGWRDEWGTP